MINNKQRYITGACYIVLALWCILNLSGNFYGRAVIEAICYVLVAISLLTSARVIAIIGFAILCLFTGIFSVDYIVSYGGFSNLLELMETISAILVVVRYILLLIACVDHKLAKKIVYIISATDAFRFISECLSWRFSIIKLIWYALVIISTVLFGYAINSMVNKKMAAKASKDTEAEGYTTNNIDKIIKLSVLLDNGLITEEEFAEKKKQLLSIPRKIAHLDRLN